MRRLRIKWLLLLSPIVIVALAHADLNRNRSPGSWRQASREPVGLAPDPATTSEAIVQVYAARTVRWRGYFGVHTWIAVKPSHADAYTVHEVLSWQLRRGSSSVVSRQRAPDARWFGNKPQLLAELRGDGVDAIIERIADAVAAYPYEDEYSIWPGPNSNTFTAFVLREIPELRVDLPPTAIGKDYLGDRIFAKTPSGTGGQLNLFGVLGVLGGIEEGVEVNLLGLTFGVDPNSLAIKLPLAGSVGVGDLATD
jgi:hypothetical protein